MIALIDADELSYKIAFRYQRKFYTILKDDKILWRCRYKEEAIESIGNRDDLEIGEGLEVFDNKGYEDRVNSDISKILYATNSTNANYYLSGDSNFRYKLATLKPYKGNRSEEKPVYLEEIREFFRYKKAESIDFLEADDLLAINSSKYKNSVICSSDKDLLTVPSLNYNISKNKLENISEEDAKSFFYLQLLIGDDVDNIPSPNGLGKAGAVKLLTGLYGNPDKEYIKAIIPFYETYLNKKDSKGNYKSKWYNGESIEDVLYEIGNLLWMHRTLDPEERWELPIG